MARRGHGDGTWRTLPNETIEYTISIGYNEYGDIQRKRFYGKNQTDCRRQSKQYLKDIGNQKKAVSDYTLGQWLDRWIQSYRGKRIQAGQKQIQQSTLDEYQRYINKIKEYKISKVHLINIKPIMITDFFNENLINYSYTVIKKTRFILNAAFESAIENDFCYKNPMRTAAIPQKPPGEKKAFSEKDREIITEFAKNDEKFGVCMLLLLHAGLRSEELRALGPSDISPDNLIKIDKAIKESGKLGNTKNGKSRVVPLSPKIAALIVGRLNSTDKYILGGKDYVSRDAFRKEYIMFFERLNDWLVAQGKPIVTRLSPHCCRHTYATHARRKGVPEETISALLGHSSVEMTEKYTHLGVIEDLVKAVKRL